MYSKLGSREGFAHWTTSHLPPRKKLVGKKHSFSLSLPFGQFPEVNEPLPPRPKAKLAAHKEKSQTKRDNNTNNGGNRRSRLRQRIGRLFRPLEMLRMVTVMFLNVTYNVTVDTFSLPRNVFIVARWLWPAAVDTLLNRGDGDGKKSPDGRRGGAASGQDHGAADGSRKDGKGNGGMQLKARMHDGLKDLGKNSKKWSELLSRSVVGGMRRGFSSSEHLDEQRRVDYLVKEARRCDSVCDSSGAVDSFRAAVALRPTDHEILVALSKSLSDLIFEKDIFHNHPLARAICSEAADISRKAIALKPDYAEAHLSLGAALGRLALWSDNREKVELSRSIRDECQEAIRLDAENDLAMHVLGRYEHQMASLGRIVRTLVRVMYGGTLAPGTMQEAENLFRRAIAIRPKRLIHRVELGKLLIDQGRKDAARAELELAMTLPREDINSEHERADAQALLKKHWDVTVEMPTFEDPPPTPQPKMLKRRSFDHGSRSSLDGLDQLVLGGGGMKA